MLFGENAEQLETRTRYNLYNREVAFDVSCLEGDFENQIEITPYTRQENEIGDITWTPLPPITCRSNSKDEMAGGFNCSIDTHYWFGITNWLHENNIAHYLRWYTNDGFVGLHAPVYRFDKMWLITNGLDADKADVLEAVTPDDKYVGYDEGDAFTFDDKPVYDFSGIGDVKVETGHYFWGDGVSISLIVKNAEPVSLEDRWHKGGSITLPVNVCLPDSDGVVENKSVNEIDRYDAIVNVKDYPSAVSWIINNGFGSFDGRAEIVEGVVCPVIAMDKKWVNRMGAGFYPTTGHPDYPYNV